MYFSPVNEGSEASLQDGGPLQGRKPSSISVESKMHETSTPTVFAFLESLTTACHSHSAWPSALLRGLLWRLFWRESGNFCSKEIKSIGCVQGTWSTFRLMIDTWHNGTVEAETTENMDLESGVLKVQPFAICLFLWAKVFPSFKKQNWQ